MKETDDELLRLPPVELVAIIRRQQEMIDKLEKRVAALEAELRESGLAMVAFQWMVREAKAAGLLVDDAKVAAALAACPPDALAMKHESLKGAWKAMELLPARRYNWTTKATEWRRERSKPRTMIESPFLHRSVLDRMAADSTYCPPNLPTNLQFPTQD